jgi:hypothetical protein
MTVHLSSRVVGQVLVGIMATLELSEELREQCVWAISNIAADCAEFRDFLISMGTVEALISQFSVSPSTSMIRQATWAISNFCKSSPLLITQVTPQTYHLILTRNRTLFVQRREIRCDSEQDQIRCSFQIT